MQYLYTNVKLSKFYLTNICISESNRSRIIKDLLTTDNYHHFT